MGRTAPSRATGNEANETIEGFDQDRIGGNTDPFDKRLIIS
jgi:hypothetical protein